MVESLRQDYKILNPSDIPVHTSVMPYPMFQANMSTEEKAVTDRLSYVSWLDYSGRKSDDFRRALYRGTLDDQPVVIKFCEKYCERAHRLLADAGYAPKLHLCTTVVGGFVMVVMDYVAGETVFRKFRREDEGAYSELELPSHVRDRIQAAIVILHGADLVFGDLRRPNVLLRSKDKGIQGMGATLVDFDWAGEVGQVHYPLLLNQSGDIDWAPGVVAGGLIKKEHDNAMLALM